MHQRLYVTGIIVLLFCAPGTVAFAANDGLLRVGVAPFSGEQAGGTPMAEAIELELELVETVLVKGGRWMKRDIRLAGARAFEPAALRELMRKRKLDVLVHGSSEAGRLWVSAYDDSGAARFREGFALPVDVDQRAVQIVQALKPVFAAWHQTPAVGASAARGPTKDRTPAGDDGGLFVDGNEPGGGTQAKPNQPSIPRRDEPKPESGQRRRMLAGTDDGADSPPQNSWMDELPSGTKEEPSIFDRSRRRETPEFDRAENTMEDVETDAGALGKSHWLAVALSLDANLWSYAFRGSQAEQSFRHPHDQRPGYTNTGGGLRASYWANENFGVDGDFRLVYMNLNAGTLPINPESISAFTYQLGLLGRARYLWDFSPVTVGLGARLGYRLWGRALNAQTGKTDGLSRTIFPGWRQHGLVLGTELFAAAQAWQRRFEVEARIESIPLTHYVEVPDNPGGSSQALSWHVAGLARIPIVAPVTAELGFYWLNSTVRFEKLGDRLTRDEQGQPVPLQGGDVSNTELGFSLAVGVAF